MAGRVHVIGAGLSGLAAALRLADAGRKVVVYEAAPQAGGRCRSYFEPALGLTIDNGNHLLLSGNATALDYLSRIGAAHLMPVPQRSEFAFIDLENGQRWTLRPNSGRVPSWILSGRRRVPGGRLLDYLAPLRLLRAGPDQTVGEAMRCSGTLWRRLWRPLLLAGLNTEPTEGSAMLAGALIRGTMAAGGKAMKPLIATAGLSATFVEPALARLTRAGTELHYGRSVKRLVLDDGKARMIDFGDTELPLAPGDDVVLAVPHTVAGELVPGLTVPQASGAIVNAHYRIAPPPAMPPMVGVVGGLSEWIFRFPDRVSVTISGADRLLQTPRYELATSIWAEVARVTGLPEALPPWQIVKERRATFASTPAEAARRPGTRTAWDNLFLAGDWTDTGLPATIEGAVMSGYAAAAAILTQGNSAERRAA